MDAEQTKKTYIGSHGYEVVSLASRKYCIHRVLAEFYIPNPENKPCVNHIDGNKLNNDISNLEWVTYSENTLHAFRLGLASNSYPQTWNWKPVVAIKDKTILHFLGITEASKKMNIKVTSINNCLKGRSKTSGGYRWQYA